MSRRRKSNNTQKQNITSNNIKEEVKNNILKIPRKCKPGDVNINDVSYKIIDYKLALNSFLSKVSKGIYGELFYDEYNKELFLGENRDKFENINLENIGGKIINVTDEFVEYEISDEEKFKEIKSALNNNKVFSYMRYIGGKSVIEDNVKVYEIMKIITFDIIITK